MKKTTLDTSLLPNVWLKWETKKGINWLECNTGKKQMEKPNVSFDWRDRTNIYITAGVKLKWTYIKYHPDIEMLELAVATIPTNRKEEVHEWQYAGKKYFLDKSKAIYNEDGKRQTDNFQIFSNLSGYHYLPYNESSLLNALSRFNAHPNWINEFVSFIGRSYYTIGNGRSVDITYLWHMQDWYNKRQITGTINKGKESKLVDKLTAIQLSDPSDFATKYPIKHVNYPNSYRNTLDNIIYFERVNEEWSVLRMFKRVDSDALRESERLYLSDTGKNRICCYDDKSGWIPSRRFRDYWGSGYYLANEDEAMEKCKRIKYLLPLFKGDTNIKTILMTVVSMPELEQLAKFGYIEQAKSIAGSTYPKAELRKRFGGFYNEKETNLLRKLGMTKRQFDSYMNISNQRGYYAREILPRMREFFGDNLAPIDNYSFEKYLAAFNAIYNANGNIFREIEHFNLDYTKFIKNLIRLREKENNVCSVMSDTMRMYRNLNMGTQPEVNWYFDSYSDLLRMHDAIMTLKLEQDAERRASWNMTEAERRKKDEEKRIKIDKERKNFEYEDDKYIIRLPKNGTEITNEGSRQRICIGGYVSRHSRGETNLFFLRKKEFPDTPFYAIEMNNAKNIVQIHGFCNKWLGNDPDAIPIVIRWLRKNGITCSNEILTCTSTGYGSNRQYVAMPVVE